MTGICKLGDRCNCGGDLPRIRAQCANWNETGYGLLGGHAPEYQRDAPPLRRIATSGAMLENDCEDTGWTKLSDGCFQCPVFEPGADRSVTTKLVKHGDWWVCPKCRGSYGAAPKNIPEGSHPMTDTPKEPNVWRQK